MTWKILPSLFCVSPYSPTETSHCEILLISNQILNWDWCNEEERDVISLQFDSGVSVREIREALWWLEITTLVFCRRPCFYLNPERVTWWRTVWLSHSRSLSFTSPMRTKAAKRNCYVPGTTGRGVGPFFFPATQANLLREFQTSARDDVSTGLRFSLPTPGIEPRAQVRK